MEIIQQQYYTYADYALWDEDTRYELIDGLPYAMSPAPSWFHQETCLNISRELSFFLKGKSCKVFISPFDVRLNRDQSDDTVVQPDITIVCDRSKLDKKGGGCNGVPDMVVEVLSPSTARMDRIVKYKKYEEAGVREYWIVDINNKAIEQHILEKSGYVKTMYLDGETIPSYVLEGFMLNLTEVFTA